MEITVTGRYRNCNPGMPCYKIKITIHYIKCYFLYLHQRYVLSDPIFARYWADVLKYPEDLVVSDAATGLKRLHEPRTFFLLSEQALISTVMICNYSRVSLASFLRTVLMLKVYAGMHDRQ